MLGKLIPLLWFGRGNNGPHFYRLLCRKCAYEEVVELTDSTETVCVNPDCDHSQNPRPVDKLPKQCPHCGASVKAQRLPCKIYR